MLIKCRFFLKNLNFKVLIDDSFEKSKGSLREFPKRNWIKIILLLGSIHVNFDYDLIFTVEKMRLCETVIFFVLYIPFQTSKLENYCFFRSKVVL